LSRVTSISRWITQRICQKAESVKRDVSGAKLGANHIEHRRFLWWFSEIESTMFLNHRQMPEKRKAVYSIFVPTPKLQRRPVATGFSIDDGTTGRPYNPEF
jgi:hypothetical protein